jgi:hypothetical protein
VAEGGRASGNDQIPCLTGWASQVCRFVEVWPISYLG